MVKLIDRAFLLLSFIGLLFIVIMFHTWNGHEVVQLPETAGKLTSWDVDSCDIKSNYAYISAWSFPAGVRKFENTLYIKVSDGSGYIKMKGQVYKRNQETSEMKSAGEFDNSGLVSAIRILPWEQSISKEIVMISRASNGKLYRGDYVCK
ncbi:MULTISPECIES: hypothetical protein [Pantoea]|jgi:hypothetical protein|uniref:hypothetical protein n=1 Tax=Pantoea TaxID=53335 RepID=UPI000EA2D2F8|nr:MULTISPECIES: hypothetical protein [Pantoea]MBZ6388543.1 hypothetical protein [Pantoea piersonii]MBZ6402273.1 hypothetical protein [Pantoea piersonii]MBZ6410524.1 hypothetical protein [Pantoea piersonii]MBZ6427402.1 hypothetical protein [Pantoea piersonii]NYB02312.1 hypothetical protein [Pantoea piersonii]